MADKSMVGKYRVRRGWFGKCILQKCYDTPMLLGGQVDASIRDIHWDDVDWKHAPPLLANPLPEGKE